MIDKIKESGDAGILMLSSLRHLWLKMFMNNVLQHLALNFSGVHRGGRLLDALNLFNQFIPALCRDKEGEDRAGATS